MGAVEPSAPSPRASVSVGTSGRWTVPSGSRRLPRWGSSRAWTVAATPVRPGSAGWTRQGPAMRGPGSWPVAGAAVRGSGMTAFMGLLHWQGRNGAGCPAVRRAGRGDGADREAGHPRQVGPGLPAQVAPGDRDGLRLFLPGRVRLYANTKTDQ
ncbi:protein of unknown function [Streptomyces sp. KY70]|nr:protein of unknown function [Streptomyces sp. KY70]